MEMSVLPVGVEPVAYTKGGSSRRIALEPAARTAFRGIEERARSPCRLLEQSTEAAHSFHLVQSIDPQPVHDWGEVIRNRLALDRAKFPPCPILVNLLRRAVATARYANTCNPGCRRRDTKVYLTSSLSTSRANCRISGIAAALVPFLARLLI